MAARVDRVVSRRRPRGRRAGALPPLPKLKKYLAYLPEGPVLDWSDRDLAAWLDPMASHLRYAGAFGIRMGPPVVVRSWRADTVKQAIADDAHARLGDVPPDERDDVGGAVQAALRSQGWRPLSSEGGFTAGQPQYVFQIPLAGRSRMTCWPG